MRVFASIVAGVAVGVVGSIVWLVIIGVTGYEVGLVAWGIGALVGLVVGASAGPRAGTLTGLLAVLIAGGAILGSKLAMYGAATLIDDVDAAVAMGEFDMVVDYDDRVQTTEYLARLIHEDDPSRYPAEQWPENPTGGVENMYPAGLWAEAGQWYDSLSEQERRDTVDRMNWELHESLKSTNEFHPGDVFSLFDVLWFVLAAASAYKLGVGRGD